MFVRYFLVTIFFIQWMNSSVSNAQESQSRLILPNPTTQCQDDTIMLSNTVDYLVASDSGLTHEGTTFGIPLPYACLKAVDKLTFEAIYSDGISIPIDADYKTKQLWRAENVRIKPLDPRYVRWLSVHASICLLYTSPSPRDATLSRMPSSA